MLSAEEFERWCQQLALSEQAEILITSIRSSPPSSLVQSVAGNVSGRYPSKKKSSHTALCITLTALGPVHRA